MINHCRTPHEMQRVSRMDGVKPNRPAGAGAAPCKSSRGAMPLIATSTAALAIALCASDAVTTNVDFSRTK